MPVKAYLWSPLSSPDTLAVFALAMAEEKVTVVHASDTVVSGITKMNISTFGDIVTGRADPSGAGTLPTITSKADFPGQLFDWGRGRRNVARLQARTLAMAPTMVERHPI